MFAMKYKIVSDGGCLFKFIQVVTDAALLLAHNGSSSMMAAGCLQTDTGGKLLNTHDSRS